MPNPRPALSLAVLFALASLAPSARADERREGPSLTVYSSADPAGFDPEGFIAQQRMGYNPLYATQVPGFGVVKEVREVDLPHGMSDLKFTDVAQFIDPTTVSFVDLTSPDATAVHEQAFRFDLASPDKILERYVDHTIVHETTKDGQVVARVEGTVLSVNQGTVVLRAPDGLRFLGTRDAGLRLPSLPSGLLTKPTLVWKVATTVPGKHRVRTTYQTAGITWRSDYNLILAGDETRADLAAWVTLLNLSGASYGDSRLKLIAGDVQRVQRGYRAHEEYAAAPMGATAAAPGFEEKAFFEYHLYTLPRRTDVLENSTQQITLFPTVRDAKVEKVLVYYGFPEAGRWGFFPQPRTDRDIRPQSNPKVDVYVRFENSKQNRLGIPLPRGKVRAYKADDADGTLEFVGEDLIDHTPKDEKVMVRLGQAFDVVGERTQVDFRIDTRGHWMEDEYKIELRNHKDVPVKVIVKENLFRWTNWQVIQQSDPFRKVDARTIHFEVDVPPNGAKTVGYRVRYTW